LSIETYKVDTIIVKHNVCFLQTTNSCWLSLFYTPTAFYFDVYALYNSLPS